MVSSGTMFRGPFGIGMGRDREELPTRRMATACVVADDRFGSKVRIPGVVMWRPHHPPKLPTLLRRNILWVHDLVVLPYTHIMQRHGFQHIGQVIREKYPEIDRAKKPPEPQPRMYPPLNDTAIAVATTIVLIATPATIYFVANFQALYGLAALVTALAAAFGPKIYADFIQSKASSGGVQSP
jgi:hypothetical protein